MNVDTEKRSYTDTKGVTHHFEFTVGMMRRLRRDCGVDLLDNSDGCYYTLMMSEERFLDVVAAVLGLYDSSDEFFDELTPSRLDELRQAFWGGLGFFFQVGNPKKWAILEKDLQNSEATIEKIQQKIREIQDQYGKDSGRPLDT